jgi:hypothetical protein
MTTSYLIARWDGHKDSFPNLSYNLFEKSGHYPMFEEPALFDRRTFRLSGPRARVHSLTCEQQQEGTLLAQPVQGVGDLVTLAAAFMMMWALMSALSPNKSKSQAFERPAPLSATDIARRVLPAVSFIVCNDGERSSQGSGFFIGPGLVVTTFMSSRAEAIQPRLQGQ